MVKSTLLASKLPTYVMKIGGGVQFTGSPSEQTLVSELGMATKPIEQLPGDYIGIIEWNNNEAERFLKDILQWWDSQKAGLGLEGIGFASFYSDNLHVALKAILLFLERVVYVNEQVFEKFSDEIHHLLNDLESHDIPILRLAPYRLLCDDSMGPFLERQITNGLFSNSVDTVKSAIRGCRHWLLLSEKGVVVTPSGKLIDNLVLATSMAGPRVINNMLSGLTGLVEDLPGGFSVETIERIELMLVKLEKETNLFDNQPSDLDLAQERVPLERKPTCRMLAARLAYRVENWHANSDVGDIAGIEIWREVCNSDPLPEVRKQWGS